MAVLEQLGAFVATHAPDQRALEAVRLHAADVVGAWAAATATEEGKLLLGFQPPDAALSDRVAIHCALARLSEVDDIHLGAMVTAGAIVVPAALTVAASLPDVAAGELSASIVAGYEAMIRLGAAIDGPSVLYRGIWPTYFAAPLGVAAVTARLMRLNPVQTANALSMALIMSAPGTGHHAAVTTARWLAVGHAAARGLQAAMAARAGFTSDVKIADGDFLKNIFGLAPNLALLGGGTGELALHRVSFKPWCAARQTMAATQALREILAEGVDGESIARIGVAVLPPHLKMIDHGAVAGDRFSHLTSIQYQMAVAVLAPDLADRLSAPPEGPSPEIAAFMARIKVRSEDALLTAGYPQSWAAHVTVTTRFKRHEKGIVHVPGDPERPLGEAEIRSKFMRLVGAVAGEEDAAEMFEAALSAAEHPGDVLRRIGLLAPRVA